MSNGFQLGNITNQNTQFHYSLLGLDDDDHTIKDFSDLSKE